MESVLCIFPDEADEMLLGAAALENFSLVPDVINKTLTPIAAMLL
jgi:hypothetical protein